MHIWITAHGESRATTSGAILDAAPTWRSMNSDQAAPSLWQFVIFGGRDTSSLLCTLFMCVAVRLLAIELQQKPLSRSSHTDSAPPTFLASSSSTIELPFGVYYFSKMAPMTLTVAPPLPTSPIGRTASPFMNPRSPPCTPTKTAELWDEYEKLALEKERERDETAQSYRTQTASALEANRPREYRDSSTSRSSFDFRFRRAHATTLSTTVSVCKTCQHHIIYSSGICERCIKTIVFPSATGETTPPLSPAARNFGVADLPELRKTSPKEDVIMPTSTSPKRASYCPLPSHLVDTSSRVSSVHSSLDQEITSAPMHRRKTSLTDPNEPFLRLHTAQQPYTARSPLNSPPMTPTSPPWTTQSQCSTRRSSLANVTMLPKPSYPHARNDSGTLSEFDTIYQTVSTTTTPPASLHRFGYPLQNQTSAWDDWDSDEEAEKAGISSWMGRRRNKSRAGKSSMDGCESLGEETRKTRKSKDDKAERARMEVTELARTERVNSQSKEKPRRQKPSGFVRALSCQMRYRRMMGEGIHPASEQQQHTFLSSFASKP
ncbi:hypothetical protein DDE82_000851 [Stemphylium lycopersici]|nr:hypothetical protein TW65_05920 [Stemphylium lycopersici]RAR10880.1 hypothetical protein DDE82_000851 [Stemphylium lycopersici]